MTGNRFDRNEQFFGREGQTRLRKTCIAVMGAGGLGSHVIAQTALLGVGKIITVDRKDASLSNRNRLLGAWHSDPIPGSPKVELARRHVQLIDPSIEVWAIKDDIVSTVGLEGLKAADYVFGCVDDDGVRFFLNEACIAYEKPLIDLASDVPEPGIFGGRVAIASGEQGCLYCMDDGDLLDADDVRRFMSSAEMLENEAAVYGIKASAFSETGPSVVSVNGVVASLGVTAFMALVTGIQSPHSLLFYRGHLGTVSKKKTERIDNCHYCSAVRGLGDQAALERYFCKLPSDSN